MDGKLAGAGDTVLKAVAFMQTGTRMYIIAATEPYYEPVIANFAVT